MTQGQFRALARQHRLPAPHHPSMWNCAGGNRPKVDLTETEFLCATSEPIMPAAGLPGLREQGFARKATYAYVPTGVFDEVRRSGRTMKVGAE